MEETISLQEIATLLKKKLHMILTIMFLCLGVSALVTYLVITPKYSSTTSIIASFQNTENNATMDNVNTNLMMINTYKDFIQSTAVLEEVKETLEKEAGFNGSVGSIRDMLTVEQQQNSQMFNITATSSDPKLAAAVVNTIAPIFKEKASEYINVDKVSVISEGQVPKAPVSPNNKLNLAIGLVLGLMLGVAFALLSELLNRTVKDEEFIPEKLGIPILGVVPVLSDREIRTFKQEQRKAMQEGNFNIEENTFFSEDNDRDGLDEALQSTRKLEPITDYMLNNQPASIEENSNGTTDDTPRLTRRSRRRV